MAAEPALALTQPLPTAARIERLLEHWSATHADRHHSAHRQLEALPATTVPLPPTLDPRLKQALGRLGVSELYSHQARALEAAERGEDIVVATPTASGKTLCYNLPVIQTLLADPRARALYLFPTKALARDQVEAVRKLVGALDAVSPEDPTGIGVAVYDGDTPPDQRRAARRHARVLATNPDMLHAGMLPHHPAWRELFSGLRYVVVDELHTYRGVFGSHVANVLRRLARIAAFHGAHPRFIATSATIGNPDELAAQLFGRPVTSVRQSGAPAGERHFVIYNPPIVDPALRVRESYLKAACRVTRDLVQHGLSTLVFCRSRLAVEVLVRYLRDALPVPPRGGVLVPGDDPANQTRVRGYRGGYLPDRRRGVEKALREGEPDVVVATSALELGIDIGSLDAVVIAGWPGSRAAAWQRAGRAGRRLGPSLTVMVASSEPVDQFVAEEPDYLFGQEPEHARIDADNVSILVPHVKCAAFELPFVDGDRYGDLEVAETDEVLVYLAEAELLHRSSRGYHYVGGQYPANDFSLRGRLDENFLVVDAAPTATPAAEESRPPEAGTVLAEVDYRDVPETLHPHAIYQLEGAQYLVERLDHEQHRAYVRRVEIDYYTSSLLNARLRVLEELERAEDVAHGEIHVLRKVVGFKKIKLHTHENIGFGDVDQPEREMHTTAFWLTVPPDLTRDLQRSPAEVATATLALAQVLHSSAALLLMSDRSDLGHAVGDANAEWFTVAEGRRSPFSTPEQPRWDGAPESAARPPTPTVFLYDMYPGGTGLAERLFDERARLLELASTRLSGCACEVGCPACMGPGGQPDVKQLATRLALRLAERVAFAQRQSLGLETP